MTPDKHANPVGGDAAPRDPAAAGRLVSRRALLRAGWVVPVVLALPLPLNAFATYGEPVVQGGAQCQAGWSGANCDVWVGVNP